RVFRPAGRWQPRDLQRRRPGDLGPESGEVEAAPRPYSSAQQFIDGARWLLRTSCLHFQATWSVAVRPEETKRIVGSIVKQQCPKCGGKEAAFTLETKTADFYRCCACEHVWYDVLPAGRVRPAAKAS